MAEKGEVGELNAEKEILECLLLVPDALIRLPYDLHRILDD